MARHDPPPCPCGKLTFARERDAKQAARQLLERGDQRRGHRPRRMTTYRCKISGWWHMASADRFPG